MAILGMTALAEHRCAHGQHARVVRAVRVVAIATVLCDRRVLPQVRPACLRVAFETGTVDGRPGEQAFRGFAVRTMAARAVHLALPHTVCVRLHRLRALLLMAVKADVCLGCGGEYRVAFSVQAVAVRAGDGVVVMRTAVPGKSRVAEVTTHAVRVLVGD